MPLRLATFNVGSLFEPDWDTRRHEVVAWLDRIDADVVCLQEVWQQSPTAGTAEWLVEACAGDHQFVFGGHGFGPFVDQNPDFRFGSAILSRWPIEASQLHRLPTVPDEADAIPALMPWELLHVRTAGLDIFTTHLAPAPTHGRHRRRQVLEIDSLIRAARAELDALSFGTQRTAMPPILTGDFNAEPDSDEIRFLKGLTVLDERTTFFQDAWAVCRGVAAGGEPGGEAAASEAAGYTNDWRTHPLAARLNVHLKRIDYVFVGDPFMRAGNAGRVLSCDVFGHEPLTGVQASDHIGLVAEIEWPTRPAS